MSVRFKRWLTVPVLALAALGAYDAISWASGGTLAPRMYRVAGQLGLPAPSTLDDSMVGHTDTSTLHVVTLSPER